MTGNYWIKLYIEILHDAKMGAMSDRLWRRTIEMFLLAGEKMDFYGTFFPGEVAGYVECVSTVSATMAQEED